MTLTKSDILVRLRMLKYDIEEMLDGPELDTILSRFDSLDADLEAEIKGEALDEMVRISEEMGLYESQEEE